ncbi:MAG: hypothetical protein R3E01_32175 [Pirellulaceae bacterium]|nr:hypothetical protein [Planctomycetales bacterium]
MTIDPLASPSASKSAVRPTVIAGETPDPYTPKPGDSFTIITADAGIQGTFTNDDTLFNLGSRGVRYLVVHPPEDVEVVIRDLFLAGDYNHNGVVDPADYTVWKDNFGAGETQPCAARSH